jgi:transposase-like protein
MVLKERPATLSAVFPNTTLQTCIPQLILSRFDYATWGKRRGLAKVLKPIYQAVNPEAAERTLESFEICPQLSHEGRSPSYPPEGLELEVRGSMTSD